MLQVAMLSFWHVHAPDYARQLTQIPDTRITAVWDEDPRRGQEWATKLGVPFHAELEAVLARSDVDAVICDAPSNMHAEVMVAAARAGKHIFTEKVMALTVAECDAIIAAVEAAGVQFMVSLPQRTDPRHLFAKKAVSQGWLGDITLMRARIGHSGSIDNWLPAHFYDPQAAGGGALIDLGCHPMYLTRWILGEPVRITARLTHFTDRPVDDNAVAVIEFANRAVGIVEASFVSRHSPHALEIYGTEGTLLIGGPTGQIHLLSRRLGPEAAPGWVTPTALPKADPSPLRQWVAAIKEGKTPHITAQDGRDLTELMEGATRSHREGRPIELPLGAT